MDISLNIVLDRLSLYSPEPHLPLPSARKVTHPELVSPSEDSFHDTCLYVTLLSRFLGIPADKKKDAVFVCLRDGDDADPGSEEALDGAVVISRDLRLEDLFSYVQNIFFRIGEWYQNALSAIIQNRSLQDIIDLSEGILQNYVQITDSSFKLLGYTKGIECDDPITVDARKYGFHPESTIKMFRENRLTELWQRSPDILIDTECRICRYPCISKIFRYSNTYFAHAVMTCSNTPFSDGTVDLFSMFMSLVAVYMEKAWEATMDCHHIYDSFLSDLYDGLLDRREIVDERARHVGIPVSGRFCLATSSADEGGRHEVSRIVKDLAQCRPDDKIILQNGRIIILTILPIRNYRRHFNTFLKDLEPITERYDLRCGVSAIFEDLMEAPRALGQARRALSCSGRTPGAGLLPQLEGAINGLQKRVVAFEESFFYILLGSDPENRTIWRGSVYYDALRLLQEYDEQHGMNNLHLLYVYLVCESRPAETGNLLHMSRNNIVYRIDRIEQMISMDLKQPAVRSKLMISYIMLQLYGFD